MAQAAEVNVQLDASRRGLLDISMRNPLLNYRPLKSRGLEIVEADISLVFRHLAREGKKLPFLATGKEKNPQRSALQTAPDSPDDDSPGEKAEPEYETFAEALARLEAEIAQSASDAAPDAETMDVLPVHKTAPATVRTREVTAPLKTLYSPSETLKRLLATYYTYNTFIEEQGVNALYLTLGMLTWYETETSEQPRQAPLLLIPVALERTGPDRFGLSYTGEEIGINECLAALLQSNFGLKLPDLPHAENEAPAVEDIDVPAYLASVEKAVRTNNRWKVEEAASALAFFSFSKLRMYYDLDGKFWPESEKPGNHPVIASLLVAGFHEAAAQFSDDDYLDDKLAPHQTRTIMDADSSQIIAVEAVKQGRNMVIQGPPGTGKSQTIANILAEALGQGKKVLFVAQKMAALEVVKQRLDSLGLGGACLELHSNKTNKKAVLAELQRSLALGRPVQGNVAQDTALLNAAQERLNRYARVINSVVGVSGMTLYRVYGELLRCETESRLLADELPTGETTETPETAETTNVTETFALPRLNVPDFLQRDSLNIRQCERLIQEAQTQISGMGVPAHHPYWGSQCKIFLPSDREALRQETVTALKAVREFTRFSQSLAAQLGLTPPETPAAAEALASAVQRANAAPPFVGIPLGMTEWAIYRPQLAALIQKGERLAALKRQFADVLIPEAWESEISGLLETRQAVAAHGGSFFRFLRSDWRGAQKRLGILSADGRAPKDPAHQQEILDALLEYRRIQKEFRAEEPRGQALFAAQWQGENSDWNTLSHLLEWIAELHGDVGGGKVPKAFLDFLLAAPDLKPLGADAERVVAARTAARDAVSQCLRRLEMPQSETSLTEQSLSVQERRLSLWGANTERVSEIIAFNGLAERLIKEGLSEALAAATTWAGAGTGLLLAFRRSYLDTLLRFAFEQWPELASFNGAAHEAAQTQFRDSDRKHLQNNRALLAETHWKNLPSLEGGGQVGVLTREFQKRSRHLPLRKLMERAGQAIQAVKPIFMMSPLSVATYLPPGQVSFDLVVFDEASQVEPVDALGALLRGKQAVVVGDSRQLPPTSFFSKLDVGDGGGDGATDDLESILGLFKSKGAPEKMLRWHYRSRHESLIAFSNRQFYENKLVLFPSPDATRQELGLFYHYLPETIYDSGGSATNRREARAVAEAVIRHARKQLRQPEKARLTLGVAAFSVSQMQAVMEQIEILRRENPDCERFFAPGGNEPFFVKNLENVQGDERDIIYISIGYGRDKNGNVSMNFGPLNRDGGERRLNVLITRARLRCEVFTNLSPEDIDLARTNAKGVAAFQGFLSYAKTGDSASPLSVGEADSPFEREVVAVVESLGYAATPQVGCAGYFVDMGVEDPSRPGRFVLGVECDGPMYDSARSARDRDRLRSEVLTRMGWRIHRIWSTDWIHRRASETKRLADAIEAACRAAEKAARTEPDEEPFLVVSDTKAEDAPQEGAGTDSIPRQEAARPLPPLPEYVCASPLMSLAVIYDVSPYHLAEMAAGIVQIESPVAVLEVVRRIGEAFQAGRITEKFRAAAMQGVSLAVGGRKIVSRGDFLWSPTMQTPPLRSRASLDSRARQAELIAPEEIRAAIERALKTAYSLPSDEVARSASRLFGIERLTAESKAPLDAVLESMVQEGRLKRHNGQITVNA